MNEPRLSETDLTERGDWTSASNSMADELCPGRHQAQKGIPEIKSEDAAFGTGIHNEMAGKDKIAPLTTEQDGIIDSMRAIEKKVLAVFFPNVVGEADQPIREQRLWISWADGLKHSGQVDVAHLIGYRALIGEFKSLPGDVPTSPTNLQLRDQAVLLATNVPGLKEIGVYVNQPLVTHSPEITIYQVKDLDRARDDLYRRVAISNTKGAPRVAGELQCKFCLAKSTCPQYQEFVNKLVPVSVAPVGLAVKDWTPQQRAMFMDRCGLAEKWINDCYEQLREMLIKDPNAIPGYVLREGRNNPTIINPGAVFANFKAKGGTEKDFLEAVVVGKGKLAEALKKVTKLKGNALEKATEACIGDNVTVTKNRPSIVKAK